MKYAISFVSWFSSYLLDFIMSYVQYHQGRSQLYHFAILMIPCNINHVSYWEDIKSFPYSIPIHDSYTPCYALWKSLNILCPFLLMYSECVKTSIKVTKKFNSCPNPRIEWKYVECIYEIIKGQVRILYFKNLKGRECFNSTSDKWILEKWIFSQKFSPDLHHLTGNNCFSIECVTQYLNPGNRLKPTKSSGTLERFNKYVSGISHVTWWSPGSVLRLCVAPGTTKLCSLVSRVTAAGGWILL